MCEMEIQSCQMPQSNRPKIESIVGFCLAFPLLLVSLIVAFGSVGITVADIGVFLFFPTCLVLGFFGKKPYSRKTGIAEIILACLLILCWFVISCSFNHSMQVVMELFSRKNIPEEVQRLCSFWSGIVMTIMLLIPAVLFISAGVESIKNAKIRALCEK